MISRKSHDASSEDRPNEQVKIFPYRQRVYEPGDVSGQWDAFQRDGFVLIRGVTPPALIGPAIAAIDRLRPFHWDFQGHTDHYKCVFNRDPFWVPFLDPPDVIELAETALGSDCHVIGQTAWRSRPGHRGVLVHADYLPCLLPEDVLADPRVHIPIAICTAHLYFNDVTEDLCPTCVIAGSHRSGRYPNRRETEYREASLEPVLCQAGDALFFRSDLWHSGSDNVTADKTRYLLQVHYGRRMVAQKFSPYLNFAFNPDILAVCTPRQRRLLGDHEPAAYD